MTRGIILGSSLKLRLVMAGLMVLLMIFSFTRLRHGPVEALSRQAGIFASLRPEFSQPYVESQAEPVALSAREVETLATLPAEADLLDDEASWNEKDIGVSVSSKAPNRHPVGLCPEKGGVFMVAQGFSSKAIILRI